MIELWLPISLLAAALMISVIVLRFHNVFGGGSSPESLKNSIEVMKLCGIFIVAGVSFYFIDYQNQRDERNRFDFEIFTAFAESARANTPHGKLAATKQIAVYREQYLNKNSPLDIALTSLSATILEDPEVRTLLSLPTNRAVLNDIASDRSQAVADLGREMQRQPHDALIEQLYSSESRLRRVAYQQLMSVDASHQTVIDDLINFGYANMDNENGIYNTVVVLSHLPQAATRPKVKEITDFCAEARLIGSKTAARCDKALSRING
jgi:hypothetical protein